MENDKTNEVKEIKEEVNKLINEDKIADAVKNNYIEFDFEGKQYRVRKPTYKERQEVHSKRCEKQIELLTEKKEDGGYKYLSERDLKNLYKQRGIDINDLDRKMINLKLEENKLLNKLGEALKNNESEANLEIFKKEIEYLREEFRGISIDKTNLLEISVENQILMFVYSYFTYVVTEIKEGEKWSKAWDSYNSYLSADDKLINLATFNTSLLIDAQ